MIDVEVAGSGCATVALGGVHANRGTAGIQEVLVGGDGTHNFLFEVDAGVDARIDVDGGFAVALYLFGAGMLGIVKEAGAGAALCNAGGHIERGVG